mmetsp:Transcript_38577/g.89063  ORF Transcript_38577/g.89063 Transcript_38577/m.89063 type:complete len:82 (-) Transcript_38577:4232-4477(-)
MMTGMTFPSEPPAASILVTISHISLIVFVGGTRVQEGPPGTNGVDGSPGVVCPFVASAVDAGDVAGCICWARSLDEAPGAE